MALLRPYSKFLRIFGKLLTNRHIDCNRIIGNEFREGGYITVTLKYKSSDNQEYLRTFDNNATRKENEPETAIPTSLQNSFYQRMKKTSGKQYLQNLMNTYQATDTDSTLDSIGLTLLYCCARLPPYSVPEDRRNTVHQVWSLINGKTPEPSIKHYHALLAAYIYNSIPVKPQQFLEDMKVEPNSETYELLLNCCAKSGNIESIEYIISLMNKIDLSLKENILNALILAYGKIGDIKAVLLNLETMKDTGISPNLQTWANVACAYANLGNVNEVKTILHSQRLNVEQFIDLVKQFSLSDNGRHIPEILKFLPSNVNLNNAEVIKAIHDLTYAGKAEDAFILVDHISTTEETTGRDLFFSKYIKTLIKAETPIDILLKIVTEITDNKNYPLAIVNACYAALKYQKHVLAFAYLEAMHQRSVAIRPHYYWPLFLQISRIEGEAGIFRVIRHMLSLNVRLNHETFTSYVFPYINILDGISIVRKLSEMQVNPIEIVTPLLQYLLHEGKLKESLNVFEKFKTIIDFSEILNPLIVAYKINPNMKFFIRILQEAPRDKGYPDKFLNAIFDTSKEEDLSAVNQFLAELEKCNIPVNYSGNSQEFETMRRSRKNGIVDFDPMGNKCLHPREMNVEQLECHLIELKAKGMNTRGVLRKLLMAQSVRNDIARVNELKEEYNEHGYLWSAGMYANLFQFYAKNGKVEEAREMYNELCQYHPDFRIDAVKILQFAKALVMNNRPKEAIEVLECSTAKGGELLQKESWSLLDAVVHTEHRNIVEKLLVVLINQGYCKRTNRILGPLIRRHLLENDLSGATESFMKMCKAYKCAPLRQLIVISILERIKKNDSEKEKWTKVLKDVIECISSIHGSDAVKADLIIGFARNGMRDELSKLWQDYEEPNKCFDDHFRYVPETDKIQILTELIESDASMSNQRITMYSELLLSLYSRYRRCQDAVELWQKLKDRKISPSPEFTKNFIILLEKNNIPLPDELRTE